MMRALMAYLIVVSTGVVSFLGHNWSRLRAVDTTAALDGTPVQSLHGRRRDLGRIPSCSLSVQAGAPPRHSGRLGRAAEFRGLLRAGSASRADVHAREACTPPSGLARGPSPTAGIPADLQTASQ